MLVPLVASTLAAKSPWVVAYTARVYYPPGDRRISRHQVYLSDRHGRRRQITWGPHDCGGVRWLDAQTIAWVRDDGTRWQLRVNAGSPTRAGHIDLSFSGYTPAKGDEFYWTVDAVRCGEPVRQVHPPTEDGGGIKVAKSCDVAWTLAPRGPQGEERLEFKLGKTGVRIPYTEYGRAKLAWNGPLIRGAPQDVYFAYTDHMSTWGDFYTVARFDRATGVEQWHRSPAHEFDFRSDRMMYAYVDPRNATPHGSLHIWAANVHLGDLKTRHETTLPLGRIWASSVALRPTR